MASNPGKSIPQQGPWSQTMASYRLLSNRHITPEAIQEPHRQFTRQSCVGRGIVLCVQDTTELDFTGRRKLKGLGQIGNGHGQGMLQHTALALSTQGRVLGILDQSWHNRVEPPQGENMRGRQKRWTEADIWGDTARRIGPCPQGCLLVDVGDRHSDVFRYYQTCRELGHGWISRATHDRYVDQDIAHLWGLLKARPALGRRKIWVNTQYKKGKVVRQAGEVELEVRSEWLDLMPPRNDPRTAKAAPLKMWAVYVLEVDPPKGVDPIEWMLLTSLEAKSLEQAQQIISWYSNRWVIEEWHRVLKEGCRVELAQFDQAMDIRRLAAIKAVVAVRLLELRDLAQAAVAPPPPPPPEAPPEAPPEVPPAPAPAPEAKTHPLTKAPDWTSQATALANDPKVLAGLVPAIYILVVAKLGRLDPQTLTPRQFWQGIAKRGGWQGRKHDGRPGWKSIWQGWSEIQALAEGAQLFAQDTSPPPPSSQ